jgi:hypothetical protein
MIIFLLLHLKGFPWQWAGLVNYVVRIMIRLSVQHISIPYRWAIESKNAQLIRQARIKTEIGIYRIERLRRFGAVMTGIYLIGIAGSVLLLLNQQRCWFFIPENVHEWTVWIYGAAAENTSVCR